VGVSRQWVSLVENGKTSVEFDLVLSALQALGYSVTLERVEGHGPSTVEDRSPGRVLTHDPSIRTSLTRGGKPLGHQRSRRYRDYRDDE
jgi:transcriptional regulator with XRE-family HTH domain